MRETTMTHLWLSAARRALSGSRHFIQAVAITWLVAGVAAGEVEAAPRAAQTGLLIVCLYFYTAAAARSSGLWKDSTFWLGMSRPGCEAEPLLLSLAMVSIALVGAVVGMGLGDETGAALGLGLAGLICLWLLTRAWPVFSVPFYFEGRYRWSGAAHGLVWSGPGLARALRVSRLPEARRVATPAFMIPMLALLGPLLGARVLLGPGFWLSFLFYAIALPFLSMLNLELTGHLLAEDERRSGVRP